MIPVNIKAIQQVDETTTTTTHFARASPVPMTKPVPIAPPIAINAVSYARKNNAGVEATIPIIVM